MLVSLLLVWGLTEAVSRAGLPSLLSWQEPDRSWEGAVFSPPPPRAEWISAPLTAPSLETWEKQEPWVAGRSVK